MAKIFYRLIKNGKLTYSDVPEMWKEKVRALLEADGIVVETETATEESEETAADTNTESEPDAAVEGTESSNSENSETAE